MGSAGNPQLCAGQAGWCEAAVHTMSNIFDKKATDALLLVNADIAFVDLWWNRNFFFIRRNDIAGSSHNSNIYYWHNLPV